MIKPEESHKALKHLARAAGAVFGEDCGMTLDTADVDLLKWVVLDSTGEEIGRIVIIKGDGPWVHEAQNQRSKAEKENNNAM